MRPRGTRSGLDAAEAERLATAKLQSLAQEWGTELVWWDAPDRDVVRETGEEFIYRWNSAEYVRTRDFLDMILVGSIVVPKDGSPTWLMGTAGSEDEELRWHRERLERRG